MARVQKYGIKYPFENNNNDGVFMDLNDSMKDNVKSEVMHILFTPKGQRLRDPNFGTDLMKYLFEQKDDITSDNIIKSISKDVKNYIPNVNIEKITIANDEYNEYSKLVVVNYSVSNGNSVEHTAAAIKI